MRRALIVGGAGFIGGHLASHLVREHGAERVVSLDSTSPGRPVPGVTYLLHDVRQPFERTLDEGFDVVFNLAAVHRTPGHPPHEYYETNVAGALNSSAYCERHRIDRLLFTSSISVYGPSEQPIDERSPLVPVSDYGRSKKLAEAIHRAWRERADGQLVVVRPAVVFGMGENGNYQRLAKLLKRGLFVFPGRKDTRKAGGYVKELARTMTWALDRKVPSYTYNFADRVCPTSEEICRAFAEVAEVGAPLGTMPLAAMNALVTPFELLNAIGVRNGINRERVRKLVNSTYVVPQRLIEDGYPYAYTLPTALADWLGEDKELAIPLRHSSARQVQSAAAQ